MAAGAGLVATAASWLGASGRALLSEEVADRELEIVVLLVRQRRQGEAPLEAKRPERREPSNAEPGRCAQVPEAIGDRRSTAERPCRTGGRVSSCRIGLRVPGVAGVEEDDAADADLVEDGELDLEVLVRLQVSADGGAVGDGRGVGIERRVERESRSDAAEREAADVEDAAEEVAREDRNPLRVGARDETELGVQLEDEASTGLRRALPAERVVEAAGEPVLADELNLASRGSRWRARPSLEKDAGRREEPVVSRVVGERGPQRDGPPVVEEVGERQALEPS